MSAQAFFFYIAGVEPCATGMFFTLYELARNPHILHRVHEDIDKLFEQDKEITYENLSKINYIENVMDEAMRLHPPVIILTRKCMQDTVLPFSKIQLKNNMMVQIPIYSIHYDAKYYPNPEVFDPDRFSDEEKEKRPNYTHMPFGEGNRMCLGKLSILILYNIYESTVASQLFACSDENSHCI